MSSRINHGQGTAAPMRRRATRTGSFIEPMESRLLMAGVDQNLNTLIGRFYKQGSVFGSDTDAFHFHLSGPGSIDVQLSRLIGTGNMTLRNASGVLQSTGVSTKDQRIQFQALAAGDFTLSVRADQSQLIPSVFYTLAVSTELPAQLVPGTLNYSTGAARDIGTLSDSAATEAKDFIGYLDTNDHAAVDLTDMYRFDVPVFGDYTVDVNGVTSDPANGSAKVRPDVTVFQDRNGDGQLSASEAIGPGGSILGNVDSGVHFLLVGAPGVAHPLTGDIGGTNYTVQITYDPFDLAGNTLATANSVTLNNNPKSFTDLLSPNDTTDIYKFSVTNSGPFAFDVLLNAFSPADFDIQLIQDKNHNGVVDISQGDIIDFSQNRTGGTEHISRVLTVPDTYFLRVTRFFGESSYTLKMSDPSTDTVTNTPVGATNLGTLTGSLSASEFAGQIDSADVYRFAINQPGEVRVNVTNPTTGAALVDVIRDVNNNGAIASGEILATLSTGHILDGVVLPAAGNNYYVRVRPNGSADVNYSLTLNFSKQTPFSGTPITISNTAANNRIEAENFDNGGDPDAYHDTDPADGPANGVNFRSSDGVDLRTTADPQGGTLRLATTKVGEFVEYTVNVLQTDVYNFEFRVSNFGAGGKFHVEVDGSNVTGAVDVPDTGGVDTMTTVPSPVSNVSLRAGPHVLRLAFDAVSTANPNIAGSVNFMNIRAAALSSGIFSLSPGASSVRVDHETKLSLSWTVPGGASWHTLRNVKLRFVDPADGRTVFWINYQEATNTFQLYDPKTKTFTAGAAPGTHTVLANRFAELRLAKSSVQAAGPASSTVTFGLDVVFHQPSRKRHLRVEAAASDDLGHSQGFGLAGTLDVLS